MTRGELVAAGMCVAALVMGGCSSDGSAPEHGDAEFLEFVQENIDQAEDQGATSDQLAILEQVKESGEVPLEDVTTAIRNAVDCMVSSGVVVEYVEETDNAGILRPNFRAQIPDGEPAIEELIWECEVAESMWVAKLYALQPSSQSATDEYVDSRLPYLRACLIDNGVAMDESASRSEHLEAAMLLLRDTDAQTDCFEVAGIDGA